MDKKKQYHDDIDSLVIKVQQNMVAYLKLAKVPQPSPQQTSTSMHANLANGLQLRMTADNLISDCN